MSTYKLINEIRKHVIKNGCRIDSFKSNNMYDYNMRLEGVYIEIQYKNKSKQCLFKAMFDINQKTVTLKSNAGRLFSHNDPLSWVFITEGFEFEKKEWRIR